MTPLRIAWVHYHLRPGGVTTVIRRSWAALSGRPVRGVVLCGEAPGPDREPGCAVVIVPGLGYHDGPPDPGLAERMEAAACTALGGTPDVWHIHNHALGKSTSLPGCVTRWAERGDALLLQMHDFAEDGRPELHALLRAQVGAGSLAQLGACLYPQGPRVHYAVLNQRDRGFLLRAGAAENQLHLLPNPVQWAEPALDRARDPVYVTYPTRGIRRKNLGEFLLWSLLAPPGLRWRSTLAPESSADLASYQRWCRLVSELKLPVELGSEAGKPRRLPEVLAESACAFTTSVAEGFGLVFLEPWLAGCPVGGRDLPEITEDFKRNGLVLDHLYARLPVPVSWLGRPVVRHAMEEGLRRLRHAYGHPGTPRDFERAWAAACPEDQVDMGCLDEHLQEQVIRHVAAHAAARDQLRQAINRPIPTAIDTAHNRDVVARHYSLAAYGERLWSVYQRLRQADGRAGTPLDAGVLLDEFLKPERFTLLRT